MGFGWGGLQRKVSAGGLHKGSWVGGLQLGNSDIPYDVPMFPMAVLSMFPWSSQVVDPTLSPLSYLLHFETPPLSSPLLLFASLLNSELQTTISMICNCLPSETFHWLKCLWTLVTWRVDNDGLVAYGIRDRMMKLWRYEVTGGL